MKNTKILSLCLMLVGLLLSNVAVIQSQQNDRNCAVLPNQILGQANISYAGAANISYAGALGEEVLSNNWDIENTTVLSDLQYADVGSDPVAIIILDDFTTEDPRASADDDIVWANAAHGWLVVDVFERIIAILPADVANLITLEILDLGGENEFRSELIAIELEQRLSELNSAGINKFVVNMSFVFVACETPSFNHAQWLQRRQQNPDLSLIEDTGGDVEYVETVLSDARVTRLDERGFDIDNSRGGQGGPPDHVAEKLLFLNLFEVSQLNNDPLRSFFRDNHPYMVVPIASSGNFKWKRPFFPARWTEVLSVSATLGDTPDLWGLSNNAEVSAPGAYFLFDDDVFRAGTSFAAPVVSVMVAVDLTHPDPICTIANNGRPELSSNGRWNDVPLLEAVADRC